MNSRTVLVDPTALIPQPAPIPHLSRLAGTRWVTHRDGHPTWTMTDPGLSRRHRRVAALAYAPSNRRVLTQQILLPSVLISATGALVGIGLATTFPSPHIPAWLIIGFLLAVAIAAAALSLVTRWRQGADQARHVVQVTGEHAQALIDIEGSIARHNRACRHAGARLSAPELLWNAAQDARAAVATSRTLGVLPPEEEVRVLDRLRLIARDHDGPGNVTTLQSMVRATEPGRSGP